jgi:predicted component of type VI protein secretion system
MSNAESCLACSVTKATSNDSLCGGWRNAIRAWLDMHAKPSSAEPSDRLVITVLCTALICSILLLLLLLLLLQVLQGHQQDP